MDLRCFIAIDIPEHIKVDIGKVIESLKKYNTDVKWVPYKDLHITLKFLGKTPEDLVPKISESLSNNLLSFKPFYITIYGIGTFPNRKHPRVIWVGIEDSEVIKKMQGYIEESMATLGYQSEEREFHPHLTVGRVRSQKGITDLINGLEHFKGTYFGNTEVEYVRLMESRLKPSGAEYHCLHEIPLGRRNSEQ